MWLLFVLALASPLFPFPAIYAPSSPPSHLCSVPADLLLPNFLSPSLAYNNGLAVLVIAKLAELLFALNTCTTTLAAITAAAAYSVL